MLGGTRSPYGQRQRSGLLVPLAVRVAGPAPCTGGQSARPHREQLRTWRPMTATGLPGLWPTRKQRRRRIVALTISGRDPSQEIPRTTWLSALVSHAGAGGGAPRCRVGRPWG